MCVTGPTNGQYGALAILLLITCATCAAGFFAYSEIFKETGTSIALAMLFCLNLFLGVWTMLAHLCVMFSDPGVLTVRGAQPFSEQYKEECLDLDDTEKAVFETDPIYQSSLYY